MNNFQFFSAIIGAIIGLSAVATIFASKIYNSKVPTPVKSEIEHIKRKQDDTDKKIEALAAKSERQLREKLGAIAKMMDDSVMRIASHLEKKECPLHRGTDKRITNLEKKYDKIDEKLKDISIKVGIISGVEETLREINKKIK